MVSTGPFWNAWIPRLLEVGPQIGLEPRLIPVDTLPHPVNSLPVKSPVTTPEQYLPFAARAWVPTPSQMETEKCPQAWVQARRTPAPTPMGQSLGSLLTRGVLWVQARRTPVPTLVSLGSLLAGGVLLPRVSQGAHALLRASLWNLDGPWGLTDLGRSWPACCTLQASVSSSIISSKTTSLQDCFGDPW